MIAAQAKRRPGRPPLEHKEPIRDYHLHIPESLAKKADMRRGNVPMSAYILQLIRDDVKKAAEETL